MENEQIIIGKATAERQSRLVDAEIENSNEEIVTYAFWVGSKTTLLALGLYMESKERENQDKLDYGDWFDNRFNMDE